MQRQNYMITAEEVAESMGISLGYAYKLLRKLNKELDPSPIGNKFGLLLSGPSGENRTHGLLNPIQARYQNCATPGHHPLPPYRSTGDMRYYTQIWQPCQQIFAIFLDFFEESMILTVMRCFASY